MQDSSLLNKISNVLTKRLLKHFAEVCRDRSICVKRNCIHKSRYLLSVTLTILLTLHYISRLRKKNQRSTKNFSKSLDNFSKKESARTSIIKMTSQR